MPFFAGILGFLVAFAIIDISIEMTKIRKTLERMADRQTVRP